MGVGGIMGGVEERVREFLGSWAIVKEQLEEIEDEGLFHSDRACRSLRGKPKDDLQAVMGEGDSGL
jgi:hypothetical protein